MKILVCGGRSFTDRALLDLTLDSLGALALRFGDSQLTIVHGGAQGADRLAGQWASDRMVAVKCYPANWKAHGKAAGPIRNAVMLEAERPELVVAFPGGRGTADMVAKARAKGVEVMEVKS